MKEAGDQVAPLQVYVRETSPAVSVYPRPSSHSRVRLWPWSRVETSRGTTPVRDPVFTEQGEASTKTHQPLLLWVTGNTQILLLENFFLSTIDQFHV